jgi:aryl-alcohol dehydrogenase-like predicted oxidoreductase
MNANFKIGLGTAAIGRPLYINIREESTNNEFSLEYFRQKGIEVLDAAYAQGIRYFDTAPGYGMAEQMLIDWIQEKKDENIEIATKWGYTYVANFDSEAIQHEIKEHSLQKLNEQWEASKNLLPWLTTYQIHSATLETGVLDNTEVLNRLAQLKDEYGIRMAITTTGANQVDVLNRALDIEVDGNELFDLFQVTYNVFDQSIALLAGQIANRGKRLVIKEALANGRTFPNEKYPNYGETYSSLNQLAIKYNVGVDAVALRFCIDSIPVYKVLSGASQNQHLSDNLKANDFRLLDGEIDTIKELAVNPVEYWNERKQLGWS